MNGLSWFVSGWCGSAALRDALDRSWGLAAINLGLALLNLGFALQ